MVASEDRNPSLYLGGGHKEETPSEVDSDVIRKQAMANLKREFERNALPKDDKSEFTSNANVEFETISNGS